MRNTRIVRNFELGVKNLMLHKTRAFLTTLGVVFGVGSVIAMLAVGEGASRQALEQIRKLGSQNIIITSQKAAEDDAVGGQRQRLSLYGLLRDDAARIRETIPHVRRTVPVRIIRKRGYLGERSTELRVVGTTHDWFDLVQREIVAGRVLTPSDVRDKRAACVLTVHGARRLLAGGATIGSHVRLGDETFEVVGIVRSETAGTGVQIPDQEVDAYIPISSAVERFGETVVEQSSGSMIMELVELHQLLVEVESVEQVEPAARAIQAMLRRFHAKEDYRISVPLTLLRQAEATKRTFNIVLGSIAGISLLVGGIGIMNIMLASVTERTREIGVRRAIGARRSQIVAQFLVETVVLSGAGGLVGIGLGVSIPWMITRLTAMPTVVERGSILLAFGISVSVGIVFGLYPAIRASRLDPIQALRHE